LVVVAAAEALSGAAGARPSARPWRPRRWLVRWPPSAWNVANERLQVLHTNSPAARRGCFLARSGTPRASERVTLSSLGCFVILPTTGRTRGSCSCCWCEREEGWSRYAHKERPVDGRRTPGVLLFRSGSCMPETFYTPARRRELGTCPGVLGRPVERVAVADSATRPPSEPFRWVIRLRH
jgi:hypothetical protein